MKATFTQPVILLALILSFTTTLNAQDDFFIYGKVTTTEGKTYEGPIRWGKEEVYWADMFNAGKERNENLRHLSDDQRADLDNRHYDFGNWGGSVINVLGWRWSDDNDRRYYNDDDDYTHQFSCQFGEIKKIRPDGRKYVQLELQNGMKFDLTGEGYNDVGLDIKVNDKELGEVEIYWNRIEVVEFMKTPSKLNEKFGTPLYGTVEAFGEKFTGFIQWDHDERLSIDKLDGDGDDGDVSIEFGKIKSIEKTGSRSRVILNSGRELVLDGSNDVSHGHRGVIVMNKDFAAIDVPWDEFDRVTFSSAPASFVTYDQFKDQKEITGTVKTLDGKTATGKLVFDLDEELDIELLQGKEGDFEYSLPFRNVKKITTHGERRAEIELKSGAKVMLDDGQDVDERNQGILVFDGGKGNPQYFRWDEVDTIEFK
jgi:hypothetical protein